MKRSHVILMIRFINKQALEPWITLSDWIRLHPLEGSRKWYFSSSDTNGSANPTVLVRRKAHIDLNDPLHIQTLPHH